jgi:hypothetical protein
MFNACVTKPHLKYPPKKKKCVKNKQNKTARQYRSDATAPTRNDAVVVKKEAFQKPKTKRVREKNQT